MRSTHPPGESRHRMAYLANNQKAGSGLLTLKTENLSFSFIRMTWSNFCLVFCFILTLQYVNFNSIFWSSCWLGYGSMIADIGFNAVEKRLMDCRMEKGGRHCRSHFTTSEWTKLPAHQHMISSSATAVDSSRRRDTRNLIPNRPISVYSCSSFAPHETHAATITTSSFVWEIAFSLRRLRFYLIPFQVRHTSA